MTPIVAISAADAVRPSLAISCSRLSFCSLRRMRRIRATPMYFFCSNSSASSSSFVLSSAIVGAEAFSGQSFAADGRLPSSSTSSSTLETGGAVVGASASAINAGSNDAAAVSPPPAPSPPPLAPSSSTGLPTPFDWYLRRLMAAMRRAPLASASASASATATAAEGDSGEDEAASASASASPHSAIAAADATTGETTTAEESKSTTISRGVDASSASMSLSSTGAPGGASCFFSLIDAPGVRPLTTSRRSALLARMRDRRASAFLRALSAADRGDAAVGVLIIRGLVVVSSAVG